jgi:hypothetical protein
LGYAARVAAWRWLLKLSGSRNRHSRGAAASAGVSRLSPLPSSTSCFPIQVNTGEAPRTGTSLSWPSYFEAVPKGFLSPHICPLLPSLLPAVVELLIIRNFPFFYFFFLCILERSIHRCGWDHSVGRGWGPSHSVFSFNFCRVGKA